MGLLEDYFDTFSAIQSCELKFDTVNYDALEELGLLPKGYAHTEKDTKRQDMHVIFDKNATTVFFDKDTKVTVKAHDENIDHEKGFAMALAKYIFSDENGHWKNRFLKYIDAAEKDELKKITNRAMKELRPFYMKQFEKAYVQQAKKLIQEYNGTEFGDDYISAKKAMFKIGVSCSDIDTCFGYSHQKAITATLRKRKNYIPTETGLRTEQIDAALSEAIERYSKNVIAQM